MTAVRAEVPIDIRFPETAERHLRVSVGACRMQIQPGTEDAWVTGRYQDPTGALPLTVTQEGGTATLRQQPNWPGTIPNLSAPARLELSLGTGQPFRMTVDSGAAEATIDLGAVRLQDLSLRFGAGKATVDFGRPNPEMLRRFEIKAGAVGLDLRNLANAGFEQFVLEGGAASYHLAFGGTLQRSAEARISAGMSSIEIDVPSSTAAKITAVANLGSLDVGDGFTTRERAFWTQPALSTAPAILTISATVALGSLRLRSSGPA